MQSHWHYAPPTVDNSAQSVGRVAKARMAMSALAWDSGFPREFAGHNQSVNDVLNFFRQRRHNFTVESPTRFLTSAVILCDVLGALCLILNLFVISALIRNRKRVLKNVFYVIVLHCAIVDLIRGSCLIAWGMPHLLLRNMGRVEDRLLGLK
uniref:G_PROTEIN_RECEP_F1_2 domain-containing protein n=1 Tax=Plectus sambesii TaxID=2011161 RepID=A0A914UV37_9BILA